MWPDDDGMQRMEDDRVSVTSQLRKTKSMDASCLDIRAMHEVTSPTMTHNLLSRAKSDFNLSASNHSLNQGLYLTYFSSFFQDFYLWKERNLY